MNSCATLLLFGFVLQPPALPKPFETRSAIKFPKVIGWPKDKMPMAPDGFTVSLFANGLDNPRWMYVLPNGDVLVSEARSLPKPKADEKPEAKKGKIESKAVTGGSANRITLLRPTADGKVGQRTVFAKNLNQPFGMCLIEKSLFVGCTDGVMRFSYAGGETELKEEPTLVHPLPKGGYNNHWTRNVIAAKDGSKLYVTVGSGSNVGEHGEANELLRANILEMNLDGTAMRVFASGLRNPVGTAWEPATGKLWTAVNERDELGDELVPDYITSVREGAFYGWPYSYFGANEDPRRKGERPDLVAKATVPDYPLGSHTASLGLAFEAGSKFPAKYNGGAFIGQHGSWNRSSFTGYRIAFVPFKDGKPAGDGEDFLTGFLANGDQAYGRPVGVAFLKDGSMLVTDDAGNSIWRVAAK